LFGIPLAIASAFTLQKMLMHLLLLLDFALTHSLCLRRRVFQERKS
jgi:hypothetical protein